MFFWTILNKPRTELVRELLEAMREFPLRNDWLSLVKSDLLFLDICHSDDYLKMLNKSEMKALLKDAILRKKERVFIRPTKITF